MKRSWLARHPVGFMALYSIFYLSVFHYLESNVPLRSILVHCRLDDLIPFCKYAVIPYFAWFVWIPFTLFYLLWKAPREDFWRLCLPLFSGMTIALACYAVLPTGAGPAPLLGAGQRHLCAGGALFVPHRHRHQRLPFHPCVQLGNAAAGVLPQPHF